MLVEALTDTSYAIVSFLLLETFNSAQKSINASN